jgi:hypothetical protein
MMKIHFIQSEEFILALSPLLVHFRKTLHRINRELPLPGKIFGGALAALDLV